MGQCGSFWAAIYVWGLAGACETAAAELQDKWVQLEREASGGWAAGTSGDPAVYDTRSSSETWSYDTASSAAWLHGQQQWHQQLPQLQKQGLSAKWQVSGSDGAYREDAEFNELLMMLGVP